MIDTITANDIFNSLVGVLNRMGRYWSRAAGIATDSAPSMIAKKASVAILITRVLYSDYIGPARLRLNLPELAPELKRV